MNFRRELFNLFQPLPNSGSFSEFDRLISNEEQALSFFEICGVIDTRRGRCICGNRQLLKCSRPTYKFGFRWVCYARTPVHSSAFFFNPLEGSPFCDSRLPTNKIFDILLNWFFRNPFDDVLANTKCSSRTISKWFKRFRKVCVLANKDNCKIGGVGHWVELDETHLFKRKYNVGHRVAGEHIWIFGGYDRNTKQRFIVRVDDRKKTTLWPLILKHVARQSILVTDAFVTYEGIEQKGYAAHEVVVHRENFKNPLFPDVYTNGVESVWSKLKRHVKKGGTNDYIDAAIEEYLYRNNLHLKYGRKHFGIKLEQFMKDWKKFRYEIQ